MEEINARPKSSSSYRARTVSDSETTGETLRKKSLQLNTVSGSGGGHRRASSESILPSNSHTHNQSIASGFFRYQ